MDELECNPATGLYEVYVGGIPYDMPQEESEPFLSGLFGNIMNMRWMEPRPSSKTRVWYSRTWHMVRTRTGTRSCQDHKMDVFSRDLDIKTLFSTTGEVANVIKRHPVENRTTSYGFVGFKTQKEALNAIKTLDGYTHPGTDRQMRVRAAIQKKIPQRQHGTQIPRDGTTPNVRSPSQSEATGGGSAPSDNTPSVQVVMPSSCAVCNKAGVQQCSQCKTVRYCSRDCQVKHWADHQKACLSIAQGSSPKALTTSPAAKVPSPNRPSLTAKAPSPSQNVPTTTATDKLLNKLSSSSFPGPKEGAGAKPPGPHLHTKQPDLAERLNGPIQRQNDRQHVSRPSRGGNDDRGNDSTRGGARGQGRRTHDEQNHGQGPRNDNQNRGPRARSKEQGGLGSTGGLATNAEQNQGGGPRSSEQNQGPRSRSSEQRGPGGRGNDLNRVQANKIVAHSGNEAKNSQLMPQQKQSLKTMGDSLKKGQKMTVQVMEVESPSQFWVQLVDEQLNSELLSQQEQLMAHYQNKANLIKTQPKQEPLVAALFPDDSMWYRAEVIRHKSQPVKFQVRYVDYGNVSVVDSIFSLERKFYDLPVMSINCGIAGIRSGISKPWSDAAKEFFKQLLGNGLCKARVVESTQGLVLLDLLTPDGSQVSEKMVEAKHAESSSSPAPSASGPSTSAPLRPSVEASAGPHVIMAANLERSALSPSPDMVMVMVTDAASPSDIIVQTTMHMAAIEEMKVEITKQQSNYTKQYTPQKVGELVLAKFSLDNDWYRAEVLNMDNKNQIHVLFVDYGNKEVVSPAQIASLSGGILSQLPVYGVKCSLYGAGKVAPGRSWDPQVLEPCSAIFNAIVKKQCGQTFKVEFTKQDSAVSVNQQLVDAGVLMPVSTMMTDLPTLDVPLEPTIVDCTVVIANSPTDICLHIITDNVTQAFIGINTILSSATLTPGYVPQQGEVVCGFFENVWNRAEVVDVKNNKFTLRYFDYGNIDETGPEGVAKLAAGLESFPPVAVVCHLPGVGPLATLKPNALSTELMYKAKLTKRDLGYDLVLLDAQGTVLNPSLIMAKPKIANKSDLPAMTQIALQTKLQMMVLQVNSLTDFYIMNRREAMESVVAEISKLPNELPSQVPESPGQLVCCFIEGEWYRMCIEQITTAGVNVQSVDYGFQQVVSRDMIKVLPKALLSIPPVARRCTLADISTPGEADVITQFKEMVENRTVTLIGTETRMETTLVRILDEAAGTFINTKFANLVAPLNDLEPAATAAPTQNVMPPLQFLQQGLPKVDMPQQFSGVVVFSIDPQHFYVQDMADQDRLMDILTRAVNHVAEVPPTEGFSPVVGDLCLGQNVDQQWYRCQVTEASAQGYEVTFIDFGDSAVLPSMLVRSIPQELLLYPALAYRCCLAGIFPKTDGPWPAAAVQQFKALTTDQDVYTFVKNQSNESFYLVGMRHCERGDLAQTLVNDGIATRRHMEAATAAAAAMSEGEVSAVEEENTRLKQENEKLRKEFEKMKLLIGRK